MIAGTLQDISLLIGVCTVSGALIAVIVLFTLGRIGRFSGSGFGVHVDVEASKRIKTIEAQMKPNGGSSAVDKINELVKWTKVVDERMDAFDSRFLSIEEAITQPGGKP